MRTLFSNSVDIKIVNTVTSFKQLVENLKRSTIDIVITEIDLPDLNGITALRTLKKEYSHIGVIVFSTQPEDIYAASVLKAGASGYLSKGVTTATIKRAILKVYKGGIYVSKELAQLLTFERGELNNLNIYNSLSQREIEVLKLISYGKKNREIAADLKINPKTVSTYKLRLMEKLKATNMVQLIDHGRQII
jgi:DNA-binding NarL/FixJ family response regulator